MTAPIDIIIDTGDDPAAARAYAAAIQEWNQTPADDRFELLVRYLGRQDPVRNAMATQALIRGGAVVADRLVKEACAKGRHPRHRIRLLDVVAQIARPLGPDAFFDLRLLVTTTRSKELRDRIARLFSELRAGGSSAGAMPPPPNQNRDFEYGSG